MADLTHLRIASEALTAAASKLESDASAAIAAMKAAGPTQEEIDTLTASVSAATSALNNISASLEAEVVPVPAP